MTSPLNQFRRVTLSLSFWNSDNAPQPGEPNNPLAAVNIMAENADVTDRLAIQLE